MAAPGLLGALTNPTVQKGVQNANNAVKGALTSLPGPVGGAYKNVFNAQTSISNSMSNNMGRLAQGARQVMTPSVPLGGMSNTINGLRASRGFSK
jgi:hypothetical protein